MLKERDRNHLKIPEIKWKWETSKMPDLWKKSCPSLEKGTASHFETTIWTTVWRQTSRGKADIVWTCVEEG